MKIPQNWVHSENTVSQSKLANYIRDILNLEFCELAIPYNVNIFDKYKQILMIRLP